MESHDFTPLFDQWAAEYDRTVEDRHGEYSEPFEGYAHILQQVVDHLPLDKKVVLEFGVGTGNLTRVLVKSGLQVIGIEPSEKMRQIVQKKGLAIDLREGTFLNIPLSPTEKVDAIVSTYAFHHLTLEEKKKAVSLMKNLLNPGGCIILADTAFESETGKQAIIERVKKQGKLHLLADLQSEYYELIPDLAAIFEQEQFEVKTKRLNRFVWLLECNSLKKEKMNQEALN